MKSDDQRLSVILLAVALGAVVMWVVWDTFFSTGPDVDPELVGAIEDADDRADELEAQADAEQVKADAETDIQRGINEDLQRNRRRQKAILEAPLDIDAHRLVREFHRMGYKSARVHRR